MFEMGVTLGVGVDVGVTVGISVGVSVGVSAGVDVGVVVYLLVDLPQAETTRETPINRASNKPNQRQVELAIVFPPLIRFIL